MGFYDYAYKNFTPEGQTKQQAVEDEHRAEVDYNAGTSGGSLGSYGDRKDVAYETSPMRWDQANAERTTDQIGNYQYGGYEGGAQDAIGDMRGYMDPYTQQLTGYGEYAMGQGAQGAADYGQGQQGLYGTADTLTQYAQQGPGPSLAQAQLEANTGAAMRQQLAMAGSGRGAGGGASAFRQAADNQALIQGQANANAGMLQAQEAADWRAAQLQAYGAAGSMYGQGAGLGAEDSQGMTNTGVGAVDAAGNMQLGQEQVANQINTGALTGNMAYEGNLTDIYGINKGVPAGQDPSFMQEWGPTIGAGIGAAGSFLAMSDVRAKKNIEPASGLAANQEAANQVPSWQKGLGVGLQRVGSSMSDVRAKENIAPASALESVAEADPYTYDYINPERHGEGRYIGPMAQDLEKAPGVVQTGPDGTKGIDTSRLALVNTSAIAELNNKVDSALAGGTQPVAYGGDPGRIAFEQGKYGNTPVYGQPTPDSPEAEAETGGFLDYFLGPSVGQHVKDVTDEEALNLEKRQYFRAPPRVDQVM